MTKNSSLSLYNYNTWANNKVINHLSSLPAGLDKMVIKNVFPSLFEILMHAYIVEHGWYSVLTGVYKSDDYATIKSVVNQLVAEITNDSIPAFQARQQKLAEDFAIFIRSQDMDQEGWFSGVKMSYADVIRHIVNHGTYHRGNIAAAFHQLGYKGVPTDYAVFLYENAN